MVTIISLCFHSISLSTNDIWNSDQKQKNEGIWEEDGNQFRKVNNAGNPQMHH